MKQSQSSIRKRTVSRLAKQYFKKNKGRNVAASLAIMLTAFLFLPLFRSLLIWYPRCSFPCRCKREARQTERLGI